MTMTLWAWIWVWQGSNEINRVAQFKPLNLGGIVDASVHKLYIRDVQNLSTSSAGKDWLMRRLIACIAVLNSIPSFAETVLECRGSFDRWEVEYSARSNRPC